jgi:hypothetical protein
MRLSIPLLMAASLAFVSCAQKAPPPRTFSLGEKITLGHLVYSAFETQWLTQIGSGTDARIPQNRFFLVRIAVTNAGGEPVASPNLTVVDDSGNSYPELSDGQGVTQWIGYIRQINQADTSQGNLVFDVPPRHYKLRLTDEDGQHSALIDLPLEFSPDAPDLMPQQRKQ